MANEPRLWRIKIASQVALSPVLRHGTVRRMANSMIFNNARSDQIQGYQPKRRLLRPRGIMLSSPGTLLLCDE